MRSKALHILSILLLTVGITTTAKAQGIDPSSVKPKSKIKILGNVYGGGDQAAVQGNTTVEINKGQYAGDIFGGGNGALNTDGTVKSSADIGTHNPDGTLKEGTGQTNVIINGGEILYDDVVALDGEGHVQKDAEGNTVYTYKNPSNHNVYGGGNQACNVAGDTHVEMKKGMISLYTFFSNRNAATDLWQHWYDQAMNPNTQKKPIASVFGAGFGAHTDVAGNTYVTINIPGTTAIHPADGEAFTHTELEDIDKIIQRWQPDPRVAEQFVTAVHGGGYDGTVGAYDKGSYDKDNTDPTHAINYNKTVYLSQTNITIQGQPFIFHVYGGGLGSKTGADANGSVNSHVGAVYGAAKVDIQGGIINGDVFGGGAGIAGQAEIPNPFPGAIGGSTVNLPYTYAAQVMRETDVTISGNSTVIFGNVYGGGDIANTGWYVYGARPALAGHVEQQNHSLGVLDYTTSLKLNGGNILGKVFGGGNGRKKSEVEQYKFVGAVIGSTNVSVNGSKIWNTIYGGGNTGCVYSCQGIAATQGKTARTMATATFDGKDFTVIDGSTNVAIFDGFVAQDIFGGGYGDDPIGDPEQASSADIYGNTFVYFERGQLEYSKYWKPREIATREHMGSSTEPEVTGQFLDQNSADDKRNTESDVCHNLYGGGNMACTVKGHTHVYMTGAPVAPADFKFSDYYTQCIANVAKPHFSVFGGGFGALAIVDHNAYSDINLREGTGFHSIIGGGMNGPVTGTCLVHVGNDPNSRVHHVYGGGYYAPCHDTKLQITRGTILENVFGGSVMGNIWAENVDPTKVATTTIIGLQNPIDGKDRHSSVKLDDENGVILRSYTYAQHQNQITIGGNVYGANDVSGTVNGVASLTIYGGTIKGDVYGAGNGDHIGYYVPDELRYDMGAHGIDNYFAVVHDQPGAPNGKTYVGRPQTIGGVELTMEGNTADERVTVLGQVFGGGNSCTVGKWNKELLSTTYFSNPHLVRDDPAYFLGGGKIDMNLGSHITIGRTHGQLAAAADGANYLIDVDGKPENVSGLYMGCSGRHLATQDWSKTDNYYHHYYDASTAKYWPGFAVYQDNSVTPLTRQEGLQSFLAYMNNILVWSDDVNLNIKNQDDTDADDIWISNFVGGGFRGSMKAKTPAGQFHYTLPRGVTIGHDIIGGAFNTDVVYRIFETTDGHSYTEEDGHYKYLTNIGSMTQADESNTTGDYHHIEYADDGTTITGIARFYYNGGMLSELDYGTDKASNDRIDRILKNYTAAGGSDVNKDFAGESDDNGTTLSDVRFNKYKRDALVYLELDNRLEVEYVDEHVHGGNVFGGCFSSGRVEGDIWTDYRCFQERQQANSEDFNLSDRSFSNAKNFEENFAMMLFGAGYGQNTNIQGSAYVRVLHPEANAVTSGIAIGYPRLYNVFGGSYEGKVEGNTNIYFNPGKYGYVTGAIYGGGCNGYVGGKTYLELAGGYIDEAYGGARNANVGGGTHIWAYDGQKRWWGEDVIHSSGAAMTEADAEKAPLFIGKLYGGTDISGQICTDEAGNYTATKGYQPYYSAEFWPKELYTNHEDNSDGMTYIDTYLQVGGIDQSDNGFPIIGSVYAAGNGENTKSFFDAKYAKTNKNEDKYTDAKLPHQHSTLMEVSDGNIVYAFGGGNRATVTDQNYILVRPELGGKHTIEDLGVQMYEVMKKRILSVGVDCYDEKLVDSKKVLDLKNASIQRLFGGNNIATMAIQPKWQLISGRVNNVYSGGNMGDMTYYNEDGKPATENGVVGGKSGALAADGSNSNYNPRGLSINIEHPEIHIGSLYGGCRLSNVIPGGYAADGTPSKAADFAESEDFYGATVNITDGYIENVYGGNDISGTVHFGTNVNISGAVSGNVYGSGNGFYLYKWDQDATQITEHLLKDFDSNASGKTLCYTVPINTEFGGTGANDTEKILTINAARPSVEKAFLNIAGLEHDARNSNKKRVAYVKGNVYCGGNASTVTGDGANGFTKFKIGSYVTLNGVFMGSDGASFSTDEHIKAYASLNGFKMGEASTASSLTDAKYYPNLLSVHMKAVEMKAQPKEFNLNLPLVEAHIGTYCGGGNRGSMLVDKTVSLNFHHDIIIYDKIVAACLNSNVEFDKQPDGSMTAKAWGGYLRPIADTETYGNTKMNLTIASQFAPLEMDVPADKISTNSHGENFVTAQAHDFLYPRMEVSNVANVYEESTRYETGCNIYGGCYETGEVEGDIILNVHSNMLRYVNEEKYKNSVAKNVACFNVYGAGFGLDSHVWGNVHIIVDRNTDSDIMGDNDVTLNSELIKGLGGKDGGKDWNIQHKDGGEGEKDANVLRKDFGKIQNVATYPSIGSVFGGGRNGMLIGNSLIEVRNGLVHQDVAGGSYAADMYGSSQVIVGYPTYYKATASATYALTRGDKWNLDKTIDANGTKVIKQEVKYLKGDLVPANVWEQINLNNTSIASANFEKIDNEAPANWGDVKIKIGSGVYGGGYSLTNSMSSLAGSISVHKLSDSEKEMTERIPNYYDPDKRLNFNGRYGLEGVLATTESYGGNSSIMIGDHVAVEETKDHVRISTPIITPVTIPTGGTTLGKYRLDDGKYTHLSDGAPESGVQYYELTGDGGVYGDGHLVFCEGFRAADITGYGYNEGTVKYPILMNTFQRLDLLSVNDCCLMLQGAEDFATNQTDATIYSIARIGELRMNSSLSKDANITQLSDVDGKDLAGFNTSKVRNYLGFFNNIHFLGSIISDDEFSPKSTAASFRGTDGEKTSESYYNKKQNYIDDYNKSIANAADDEAKTAATNAFKRRNVGTARNAVGINNGYCLRIQNNYYKEGEAAAGSVYYGPIVGVVEVKLLTLVEGEGGGYVYADNVHAEKGIPSADDQNGHYFLNVSGNFVFPGIVRGTGTDAQYIVDDCFPKHYGTNSNKLDYQNGNGTNAEAHYWYVEGNKYFYHTTLTGYTFSTRNKFELIDNDPNILLSGLDPKMNLSVKSVDWNGTVHREGYKDDLQAEKDADWFKDDDGKSTILDGRENPYDFTLQVGRYMDTEQVLHDAWEQGMPRTTTSGGSSSVYNDENVDVMPVFNVSLNDNVNNAPYLKEQEYYEAHLNEPDVVKIVLEARTDPDSTEPDYTYTITMRVVYLQGPSFTGGPVIENCALPGERIRFTSKGVTVHTTEQLPLTKFGWWIVKPVKGREGVEWQTENISGSKNNPEELPSSTFTIINDDDGQHLEGFMDAYYYRNSWNVAYIFTAGGHDFAVLPQQDKDVDASKRMLVVHNYHRMKHTFGTLAAPHNHDLQVKNERATDARIYIEDNEDMNVFLRVLNGYDDVAPYDFEGRKVYLMSDIDLANSDFTNSDINALQKFKGLFDGMGHTIKRASADGSFDASKSAIENNNASIKKLFTEPNLTGTMKTLYTQEEIDALNEEKQIADPNGKSPGESDYIPTYPADYEPLVLGDVKTFFTSVVNLLVLDGSADESDRDYLYGKMAYDLNQFYIDKRSHELNSTTKTLDYVEDYYYNGDYQYAGLQGSENAYLRLANNAGTAEPFWDSYEKTNHDTSHKHDVRRWNGTHHNVPLYEADYATNETYDANKKGDFNDYIYFGQNIAKDDDGHYTFDDKQPHAIVNNNNIGNVSQVNNASDMSNRVFRAEGFYHTKKDEGFFHNEKAVVIDPYTTAVAFGDESMSIDQPELGIKSFNVDSNLDYAGTGADYDNATTGHVTQNLLVYTMKSNAHDKDALQYFAAGTYDATTKEEAVCYHTISSDKKIANLHLVDKQDFNAPYEFNVTGRAWYERMPNRWRNVSGAGESYSNASAWEGICLPFTAKKVTASENGEISHFYGKTPESGVNDRTLHHEYWLTGFTSATTTEGKTIATFYRPSKDAAADSDTDENKQVFADGRQDVATSTEYTYPANTYFTELTNYTDYHDELADGDPWARTDPEWYKNSHTFADYVYLSKTVPYIIAFPGNDFYEFSMEGTGYDRKEHEKGKTKPQLVTFENTKELSTKAITIAVSDEENHTSTANGYNHVGTYMRKDATRPVYEAPSMLDGGLAMNARGTKFETKDADDAETFDYVLPFRTYMKMKATTASPAKGGCIWINDGADYVPQIPVEEEEESDIEQGPGITIKIDRLHVIVNSTFEEDRRLDVYTPAGQMVMIHTAKPGRTDFYLSKPGLYVIGNKRFLVRNK